MAWKEAVLTNLELLDPVSAGFIQTRRVWLAFWKQGSHISAFWAPGNRIYLNARYFSIQTDPEDARLQSVLIHEVCHLKQGFFKALSVYGELEAWQLGFRIYRQLSGLAYHPALVELMSLPVSRDRQVLRRAQILMQGYAGKEYRADLLPLVPIGQEIQYRLGISPKNIA